MVHTVGAVEHDTLFGQSLGEILGRLSLSSTGRTSWSTTEIKLQSTHESHVALIREGRNHKTRCVTEILVTVWEIGLNTLDTAVTAFPIVTKLRDPLELRDVADLLVNKTLDDISSVHINDDKSTKSNLLKLLKRLTHQTDSV